MFVPSYVTLFMLQHRRWACRIAHVCIFGSFCFLLSIQSVIWSEKCGTTLLCILKIILPIFLQFNFPSEKSVTSFPSLGMKISHTINLNEFIPWHCSLFAPHTSSFQSFSYVLFFTDDYLGTDIVLSTYDLHFNKWWNTLLWT